METSISQLRKEGHLAEAYAEAYARHTENPNDLSSTLNLLWVYYDYAKQQIEKNNLPNLIKIMKQVCPLMVMDQTYLINAFNWSIIKILYNNMSRTKPDSTIHLVQIYTPVFINQPKSETKSILIQAVLKYQHIHGGLNNLISQLDFDSFGDADFKHQTVNEKKIMPLAERWFYAYMKIILENSKESEFERYMLKTTELLQKATKSHHYSFAAYYHARFLLKAKRQEDAIEKARIFLLQNTSKSYAWELLAECKESIDEKMPLLAKAIDLNKKSPEFSLTSRKKMLEIFLSMHEYELATLTAETIIAIRQRNQWPIPEYLHIEQAVKQNYNNVEVEFINRISAMCQDVHKTILDEKMKKYAVVSGFDERSGIRYFLTEDGTNLKTKGFSRAMMGDLCYIWVNDSTIVHLEIQKPIVNINKASIKTVKGHLKAKESFGFVEGVYVSAGLLKGHKDGDEVSYLCVKEKNRKTEKLDWRAIKLL